MHRCTVGYVKGKKMFCAKLAHLPYYFWVKTKASEKP